METFRFPTLDKTEQHQTVQQRLEKAQQFGWQSGFDEGVKQGAQHCKDEIEKDIEARVESLVAARLAEQQSDLIQRFDNLLAASKEQLNVQSDELNRAVCELVRKVTEKVLDCELKQQPSYLLDLVEQALSLLAGKDEVTDIVFSYADEVWLSEADLSILSQNITFDEQLESGNVLLKGQQQTHSLSFSQRLDEVLEQAETSILDANNG